MKVLVEEFRQIQSGRRQLRQFAWLFAAILAAIAAFGLYKQSPNWPWWAGAAGFFLLSGLLAPQVLKPIHLLWMGLAVVLGLVVSHVLLAVIFFILFGLLGLSMRLAGKDLIDRFRLRQKPDSYWNPRTSPADDTKRYEQQF